MRCAKLTLNVDKRVIASAKRYAKQRGVSISEMVEAYLALLAQPVFPPLQNTPILHSVRGSLKQADRRAYRTHLALKYR